MWTEVVNTGSVGGLIFERIVAALFRVFGDNIPGMEKSGEVA